MDPENVPPSEPIPNEEAWKRVLLGTDPGYARLRSILKHIPSEPRCKLCAAPFRGIGRPVMRAMGRNPWPKNQKYCGACFQHMNAHHGGAEIESSFLFADVRGSTTLAERISPTEFRRQLDRFYDTASHVMVEHDAIVDKFVGDEVVALFIPALAHAAHAARAIEASLALLKATGHDSADGPWIPVGIGVHTGIAFVGIVGAAPTTELTALGDVVNTTARLASAAAAGEVLVTAVAAKAAALDTERLERRHLELKGKREATDVFVATVTTAN
ncbi:MAG: adenylate/guanylate cyclase domain-containing protein [Chloroflexota bacterium]|nr:adenylate/guanylate cyclase domain-containing protein [Chloroflexota bacterium]